MTRIPFPSETYPFVLVEDVSKLLPVLEKRLPKSCVFYNAVKMSRRSPEKIRFYSLNGEINESSWFASVHYREDYGLDYSISASEENSKISASEAKRIFSESKLVDWEESYFFIALEKWVSEIIFDVSLNVKGNVTEVHPCQLFYMDIDDSLALDTECKDPNAKVQKLDITTGVDFIIETWAYAKEKTDIEVRKCIERYETGGIYVDDKPVCGVICQGFGMLTALYTLEQHRKKGYAKLCMKYAFKEMASSGLIPALTVELFNKPSIAFHSGLGCKIACRIEFVMCSKLKL